MGAEVDQLCEAIHNSGNGYRERMMTTCVGTLAPGTPKLRADAFSRATCWSATRGSTARLLPWMPRRTPPARARGRCRWWRPPWGSRGSARSSPAPWRQTSTLRSRSCSRGRWGSYVCRTCGCTRRISSAGGGCVASTTVVIVIGNGGGCSGGRCGEAVVEGERGEDAKAVRS